MVHQTKFCCYDEMPLQLRFQVYYSFSATEFTVVKLVCHRDDSALK